MATFRGRGVCGFEAGDSSAATLVGSATADIRALSARHGNYGYTSKATVAAAGRGYVPNSPAGVAVSSGEYFDFRFGFWLRPIVFPSANNVMVGGFNALNLAEMNTAGALRLNANGVVSGYNVATTLNAWHYLVVRVWGIYGATFVISEGRFRATIDVYDAGLTLLGQLTNPTPAAQTAFLSSDGVNLFNNSLGGTAWQTTAGRVVGYSHTVSAGGTGNGVYSAVVNENQIRGGAGNGAGLISPALFVEHGDLWGTDLSQFISAANMGALPSMIFGANGGSPAATRELDYDDGVWDWRIGTEASSRPGEGLPLQKNVYPFLVTSQGAFDQFTPGGAFGNVDEVPSTGAADTVASGTAGNKTTYRHNPIGTPTDVIAHVRVISNMTSSAGGANAIIIDTDEIIVSTIGSSGAADASTPCADKGYGLTPITAAAFANLEFGWKVGAGGNVTIRNIFLEVLSGDPAVFPESTFPSGSAATLEGRIGGLFWAEFTDRADGLHVWTHKGRDLPDDLDYYGGFKEGLVLKALPIRRALSDRSGQYEGLTFGVRLADETRAIRAMLSTTATKTFLNCTLVERMISDPDRRAKLTPRTVGRGQVRGYSTDSPLFVELHGEDTLAVRFSSTALKNQIPVRRVTTKDFPNCAGKIRDDGGNEKDVAAEGLPVPAIYGLMSKQLLQNQQVGLTPGVGGALEVDPNVPNAGEYGGNANGILGASTFAVDQGIRFGYVAIIAGKQGPYTRIAGTMNMTYPAVAHPAFSWPHIPGVDSYRVFMFDGWYNPNTGEDSGNTFVRYKNHDNVTFDGFFGADHGVEFFGPADGTDARSPGTPPIPIYALKDVGYGPTPYVYCGVETVDGVSCHVFLLSGHANKAIVDIYVNEVAVEIATARGPWKVPGFDGRPKYEVRNGNRYAIVYGQVGIEGPDIGAGVRAASDGKIGLGFGVQGIESVGDGSGTLITSVILQYLHAFQNWILQTYLDGAWLTTPVFTDDSTLTQIDEDSYAAAEALAQARKPGGYQGAFVIGANNEKLSARDLIARFNQSGDVDSGFNRKCQWMIDMIDERAAALTVGEEVIDVLDIDAESFDSQDETDQTFNHLPIQWEQDYIGKGGSVGGFLGSDELINQDAEDEVREEKIAPEVTFYMLTDGGTARDIAERRQNRVLEPPRLVKFTMPLRGVNFELGDVILLTHFSGIGPAGWVSHPIRVTRMETDPDALAVYIEGYDLQRFVDFLTEKGTGKYGDWLGSFGLADKTARFKAILDRALLRRRPLLWTRATAGAAAGNLGPTFLATIDRTPDTPMRQPIRRPPMLPRGCSAAASSTRINLGPTAEEP